MQENKIQEQNEKQETKSQVIDFSTEFDALINAKGKITTSMLTTVNRYFCTFLSLSLCFLDALEGKGGVLPMQRLSKIGGILMKM